MSRMRVFVSSPYTLGDKGENVRVHIAAGQELLEAGHIPFLPLLSHFWEQQKANPYETWLALDLAWLAQCKALVRLPGKSVGADREVAEAFRLGMPVYRSVAGFLAWHGRVESWG